MSTFFDDQESKSIRRISMLYYPLVTKKLLPIFRKHDFEFAPKCLTTLKSAFGSNKDQIHSLKKVEYIRK